MKEESNHSSLGKNEPISQVSDKKQAKTGAGTYLFALFAIALLLLLMAYFMQERADMPVARQSLSYVTQHVQTKGLPF